MSHTLDTIKLARNMYDDGNAWTPPQIAHYLTSRGTPVAESTVRRWVIPGEAEKARAAKRRSYHRCKRLKSQTPLLDRMKQLREAGVTYASIARVIQVDEGVGMTEERVRSALRRNREPQARKVVA